ncbi:MAG: hypothetical protein AMXMBFR58_05300 [Phycisphaerae bacterium]
MLSAGVTGITVKSDSWIKTGDSVGTAACSRAIEGPAQDIATSDGIRTAMLTLLTTHDADIAEFLFG